MLMLPIALSVADAPGRLMVENPVSRNGRCGYLRQAAIFE